GSRPAERRCAPARGAARLPHAGVRRTSSLNLTLRPRAVTSPMLFHVDATTRDTLEQLRFKYAEMLSMRLAHESGNEDPAQARRRRASLAAQFPGALREIDDLELVVIRERIGQLDAALRGEGPLEPWMRAVGLFHALARGALHAKRWLAGRKAIDA